MLRMAPDEACATDMLVLVRWQGRKLAVPLAQLTAIDPDESTERGNRRLALLGSAGLSVLISTAVRIAAEISRCMSSRIESDDFTL